MPSKTWDCPGWPRATATFEGNVYTIVVDGIDGLSPQRETSASERVRGIVSLDPPTVRSRDLDEVIDLAVEATDVAVQSTLGTSAEPGELLMIRLRVAMAVRGALTELGVDV
jgi:hypothetical protein